MPVKLSAKVKKLYLDYFQDPERFRIPGRDPTDYNVQEHFFGNIANAQSSLIDLLREISPFPKPISPITEGAYAEFTVTGHAKVEEIPGQNEGVKLLIGQTPIILVPGAKGEEKAISQNVNADPNALVITSTLPRAIHHAMLKYFPETKDELRDIGEEIKEKMDPSNGTISLDLYLKLFNKSLEHGIVPSVLLNSHFHGPRDLLPERWEQFDIDDFIKSPNCQALYTGIEPKKVRQLLTTMKEYAKHGRDPFQLVEDGNGMAVTENLPLYAHRVSYLLQLFSPTAILFDSSGKRFEGFYKAIKGRKINFVGHSSNVDIISAYFKHFSDPTRVILEKADKSKTRGKEIVIKVSEEVDKKGNKILVYLNDPARIEVVKNLSTQNVVEQRKTSLDDKIREPVEGAIIPVELLRFERKRDPSGRETYEPHPISVDDVLKTLEPTLWLGNFGQGKSTAAIELTERLNAAGDYIAVLITATEINKINWHNELLKDDPKQNERRVVEILSRDVSTLPNALRSDYRFVFILDAFDEVVHYRTNIMHAVKNQGQLSQYGKVVVTSRFPGFQEYENPGFTTLHLDPQAVIRNIDTYLALRIPDEAKREKFKDFLMQQDEGVKTNYLLVYFLTNIYNRRPQDLGDLSRTLSEGEVLIKGIENALWDNKLTKRTGMPDGAEEPRPYKGQPADEVTAMIERYEAIRGTHLEKWMNFLQKIAGYMTTHDQRMITRPEIEQIVSSGWTLAKYVTELKGR